jgi:hypothetical protein
MQYFLMAYYFRIYPDNSHHVMARIIKTMIPIKDEVLLFAFGVSSSL